MSKVCVNGNHIIGCGYSVGAETLHSYIENKRKHPGYLFRYCPECGGRINFIDTMADNYEKANDI